MPAGFRQWHDGMQARVRLDNEECSDKFDVGQDLRQGCVLAPLQFNMVFAALTRATDKNYLIPSLMKPPGTARCSSNERRKGEQKRANHERAKSPGERGRKWRRPTCCGS